MNRALLLLVACLASLLTACPGESGAPKQVPASYAEVRDLPGHVAHLGKTTKIDGAERVIECKDCHEVKKEGFVSPGAKPCGHCHEKQEKAHHLGSKEKPTPCTTCHVFAPNDAGSKTPHCLDCHKEAQGKMAALPKHLTSGVACTACHSPHGKLTSALATCTSCHVGLVVVHGAGFAGVTADGGVPADGAATDAEVGPPVPLSSEGVKEAWNSAMPAAPFTAPDGGTTDGGAVPAICSTCHAPHAGAKDAKDGCATCHVGQQVPPGGEMMAALAKRAVKVDPSGAPAKHLCITCHSPHAARKDQVTPCLACHADHSGVSAVKSHGACTTCHAPHSPKGASAACTKCHVGAAAFGAAVIPKHALCGSCHNVHTPTVTPAASCEKCHSTVAAKHPAVGIAPGTKAWKDAPPEKRVCIGCHKPHGVGGGKVAACTSCHAKIGPHKVVSDTQFHAATGGAGGPKAGMNCVNCHKKHSFHLASPAAPAKGALCRTCHEGQTKALAKGHDSCLACHLDQHVPTKNVACGGCHTKQAASAPKGHAACKNCHDGHSGARIARDGAGKAVAAASGSAFCTSCHANKTKAIHASIATGCATCHRPHGPNGVASPPACSTCHTALAGLHSLKTHAEKCSSCHLTSHAPVSAVRETCTATCHEKAKNHQPGAKVCNGCHIFRK